MQLNKISLQFLFDDYERVAYSLPTPTQIRVISKYNHQGYVCITYELKHLIKSKKQLKWLANIKHSMKNEIRVDFDFVEYVETNQDKYKKYSLEELSQFFKSINTIKYPKSPYVENKKAIYRSLCIHAKNLYYYKILSLEMVIYESMNMNDILNKPYTDRELLNLSYKAYEYITRNKENLKQRLSSNQLKRALKEGGEKRGKQMKDKKETHKRLILGTLKEECNIKKNGKPNIHLIAKKLNLSRPTVTKILKEILFSFLPFFFISYVYLYSYLIGYGYEYHNVIANFTLLTEQRFIGGYRV